MTRFTGDEIAQILHETDRYDAGREVEKLRRFLARLNVAGSEVVDITALKRPADPFALIGAED